ncbi:MAG TPA: A24 family peptidase [Anaerolineales bacterium]|nr:A24 family peptidase [Anaerolineales bacterium]
MSALLLFPIVLGWLAGIFINYASDVLPLTRRFSPAVCPQCQTPFSIVDYLTLHPCRQCGKKRSLRTWLVQILTVVAFVYFWVFPSERLGIPLGMLVLIYFGIITVIDLEHRLILHPTSLVGAVLGLFVGTFIYMRKYSLLGSLGQSLLGGVIGFGIMFLLYQFGVLVARMRARRMQAAGQAADEEEALGGGDVYLAGVLGLMLGPVIINALVYGVLLGGMVSLIFIVALLIRRRYAGNVLMNFIPYGPYFIIGAFYLLFLLP